MILTQENANEYMENNLQQIIHIRLIICRFRSLESKKVSDCTKYPTMNNDFLRNHYQKQVL